MKPSHITGFKSFCVTFFSVRQPKAALMHIASKTTLAYVVFWCKLVTSQIFCSRTFQFPRIIILQFKNPSSTYQPVLHSLIICKATIGGVDSLRHWHDSVVLILSAWSSTGGRRNALEYFLKKIELEQSVTPVFRERLTRPCVTSTVRPLC